MTSRVIDVRVRVCVCRVSEKLTGECRVKHARGEAGLVRPEVNLPLSILRDPSIDQTEVIDIQTTLQMGGIDTVRHRRATPRTCCIDNMCLCMCLCDAYCHITRS